MKSFFEPESVVNVHRIRRIVNGIFVPSTALILTFDKPTLPDRIRLWIFQPLSAAVCSKSLVLF